MSNTKDAIEKFFVAVEHDARISRTHVSIYCSILYVWSIHQYKNPVLLVRDEIMHHAKISGRYTYGKHIRQLSEYGYLQYIPSSDPCIKSKVLLTLL